jgi:predicted  nucleic acid-binding Zn-ribbon protein
MLPANIKSVEMCHFFNMLFATRTEKMRSTIINANKIDIHVKNLKNRIQELKQMHANGDMRPEVISELKLCNEHLAMFQKYKSDAKQLKKDLRHIRTIQPKMEKTLIASKTQIKSDKLHKLQSDKDRLMQKIQDLCHDTNATRANCSRVRRMLPWLENINKSLRAHTR